MKGDGYLYVLCHFVVRKVNVYVWYTIKLRRRNIYLFWMKGREMLVIVCVFLWWHSNFTRKTKRQEVRKTNPNLYDTKWQ